MLFKEESYRIIGACFEVYKEMGCGFLEAVYQECLEMELARQGIPFRSQVELGLQYKGTPLIQVYIPLISSASSRSSWRLKPYPHWTMPIAPSCTTT